MSGSFHIEPMYTAIVVAIVSTVVASFGTTSILVVVVVVVEVEVVDVVVVDVVVVVVVVGHGMLTWSTVRPTLRIGCPHSVCLKTVITQLITRTNLSLTSLVK